MVTQPIMPSNGSAELQQNCIQYFSDLIFRPVFLRYIHNFLLDEEPSMQNSL